MLCKSRDHAVGWSAPLRPDFDTNIPASACWYSLIAVDWDVRPDTNPGSGDCKASALSMRYATGGSGFESCCLRRVFKIFKIKDVYVFFLFFFFFYLTYQCFYHSSPSIILILFCVFFSLAPPYMPSYHSHKVTYAIPRFRTYKSNLVFLFHPFILLLCVLYHYDTEIATSYLKIQKHLNPVIQELSYIYTHYYYLLLWYPFTTATAI